MTSWKRTERRVAQLTEGSRVGATGRRTEDVTHAISSIKCKHRKTLPRWLTDTYAQSKRNAHLGKTPLVVLHQAGSRDYIAMLLLPELMRLLSAAPSLLSPPLERDSKW
jgi:hypothetical protein